MCLELTFNIAHSVSAKPLGLEATYHPETTRMGHHDLNTILAGATQLRESVDKAPFWESVV